MSFQLDFTDLALLGIEKHKRSGQKSVLKKIKQLLLEIRDHPRNGTGQPEQLKYYERETWSRRISKVHRLIYEIIEIDVKRVVVLSTFGHYDDK